MAGQIEFLGAEPEGEGPQDSAEPVDRPQQERRGGRRGVVAFGLLAALIVGLLVARSVTSGGRHTAASATPTPSTVSGVAKLPTVLSTVLAITSGRILANYCAGSPALAGAAQSNPLPQGGTYNESGADSSCTTDASSCPPNTDSRPACTGVDRAPAAALRAVTERFPEARLALTETETLLTDGRLWYRKLLFALPNRTTLRVDVIQRGKTPPAAGERQDASGLFGRVTHVSGKLLVLVSIAQVSTTEPDYGSLKGLVEDPRLVALQ